MSEQHFKAQLAQLQASTYNPDEVHWQSIAVLLCHSPEAARLNYYLADGRYFREGVTDGKDCCETTSLYLSPSGMPYFVKYGGHAVLTWDIFDNLEQNPMNRAGWMHISGSRVDIEARPTSAQERWLADNNPYSGVWNMSILSNITPEPYERAAKFDVRPVYDGDIDRLFMRIERAMPATLSARFG